MSYQDNQVPTGTNAWNNAQIFTWSHVGDVLYRCRKYITIAMFGTDEIGTEFQFSQEMLTKNRINALLRLHYELEQLVSDVDFMMGKAPNKIMDESRERLNYIRQRLGGISRVVTDARNNKSTVEINEKYFQVVLDELRHIKSRLHLPLNAKQLIFSSDEEPDLEALKQKFIEGG